jgi:site-specific DNA-methyltransferase (adenine-specific)
MWVELKRIIKTDGAILLFGSEPFSSHLRLSNIKMFKYDWVWYKNKPSGALNSKFMPMNNHEIISVFFYARGLFNGILEPRDASDRTKKNLINDKVGRFYGSSTNGPAGDRFCTQKNIELRKATTVRYFKCDPQKTRFHPTQKPVALLEYLIKTYTLEGEIVLDFTMGSGSTGVACKNLNRNFIGIEKDKTYFDIANKRLGVLYDTNNEYLIEQDCL